MKILIVAPVFPPDKSVGAVRMASLARYLVETGYNVNVLTNKKTDISKTVKGLTELREVDVISGLGIFKRFKNFSNNQKTYIEKFRSWHSDNGFDIVIISGGPFYTFGIAKVAKKLGVPCILDFRDPWILDVRGMGDLFSPKRIITKLLQMRYERQAVAAARQVVTVTNVWIKNFKKFYPKQKQKFILIENGYDDELLKSIDLNYNKNSDTQKFTLGVFGKLIYYTKKYSRIFISAIKIYKNDLRILQIGDREPDTDIILNKNNLQSDIIDSTGFVQYEEGIQLLNASDAFLIIDIRKGAIGTKIYDYIFLNKPIIYVGPSNTTIAQIVSNFSNGYVCKNKKEIEKAINSVMKLNTQELSFDIDKEQFARSNQNRKWLKLIENILSSEKAN